MVPSVLILGGTAEAVEIAARLAGIPDIATVTSLAGLTRLPGAVSGRVRRGGFGGVDGLATFLAENDYNAVIDATHPFAGRIAAHAAQAAGRLDIPHVKLWRPGFDRPETARILEARDMSEAADQLPSGARVFLAAGRRELAGFKARNDLACVIRMIEPPAPNEVPRHWIVLVSRPHDDPDEEEALLRQHDIEWLVAKDSGGKAQAKVRAAIRLGLPIILIRRPPPPPGLLVETVDGVMDWVGEQVLRPNREH